MTTSYLGNRHPRLGRFLQNRQLLVHREPTSTLDPGKHCDSIYRARHSRTPRLTPGLYLYGYVRSRRGLLHASTLASRDRAMHLRDHGGALV